MEECKMATNKKATIDFSQKKIREIKEFILKEKVDEHDVIVGNKISHGKTYYKCENPKFIKTV